ncbi:McrB family protein [Candidatus Methylobacter oryzae]|uniref:ATPase dynein-related AAA domain-containing protein n=1 Tax=Candidatus Methylobacter oryzae TaxID=2497749 RepID=A0ABY3CAW6_9GAMM|nr:AAA family ATPase [Candidatus Methylobacter oryzae]TRW95825.1 hypothetical protein EKO24_009465 [Candidatus Methylobacter oryzae]
MKIKDFNPDTGEIDVEYDLKNIFGFFASKGFNFPEEVITRYVLSLATKPFVMLSGISGTGKTKIAQLFADYMCQDCTEEERERRIAFVPVRPDWLDNRGILGYYNILEQAYSSTPILRLLLEAAKEENQEKPYFIILDEMNLAKVEYYFADFLSIMESRTMGSEKGEKLHLHDGKQQDSDDHGIVRDADGTEIPRALHIPDNVYFTGTVNIDESTYMFSPKVLDRANVIEFNEVNLLPGNQAVVSQFRLMEANIEKINNIFDKENRRAFCHFQDVNDCRAKKEIDDIHKELKKSNLHFGYRVANEFARFINLSDDLVGEQHRSEAIDIQILQKILPKFHGTQGKLLESLTALKTLCDDKSYNRSSKKLEVMLKQLEQDGYTSFIQ